VLVAALIMRRSELCKNLVLCSLGLGNDSSLCLGDSFHLFELLALTDEDLSSGASDAKNTWICCRRSGVKILFKVSMNISFPIVR
jgi:hypothetical protein